MPSSGTCVIQPTGLLEASPQLERQPWHPSPEDTLCYGDCLDWMQWWDDASVDLIYLDPPFKSDANYNVLYAPDTASGAQARTFADTGPWDAAAGERLARYEGATARPAHGAIVGLAGILGPSGMLAYLTYMAERLESMHRLLKPAGSLYFHCDLEQESTQQLLRRDRGRPKCTYIML